jgi:Cu-Zn family superoxide dismutase
MKRIIRLGLPSAIVLAVGLWGCTQNADQGTSKMASAQSDTTGITRAVAMLYPADSSNVHGLVTFTQVPEGVEVVAVVQGLTPGEHGFHIHQYGDCSALDASSAGGHFNPENKPHGAPTDTLRHVGDLGNLMADEQGLAHLEWTDTMLTFSGPHSIIGRAVVVHANADDLKTQPTGNAGARVACGVIGLAKQ